ncbi:MAG: molybdenum cofactor biosynthesis protein MoaE [Pontixanthobacter sp.]
METCILTLDPFEAARALAEFTYRAQGCGAVASFTGLMRPANRYGASVSALSLHVHPRLTLPSMQAVHDDAMDQFDIRAAHIVHRHGTILPNEAIVFVAAASAHRRAAFDAVDCMMDSLKTQAMFWKREDGEGGSAWIEPTAADYSDRARWT